MNVSPNVLEFTGMFQSTRCYWKGMGRLNVQIVAILLSTSECDSILRQNTHR